MSIKTWQERFESMPHPGGWLADATQRSQCKEAEIDELRAALQERDAEIAMLKTVLAGVKQDEAAQRKVLEQALDALKNAPVFGPRSKQHKDAITAIQEVLS